MFWLYTMWNLIGQHKSRGNLRLLGNTNIRWYNNTKTEKWFSCYLSLFLWGRWLVFIKQSSEQPFKVSCSSKLVSINILQNHRKTYVSESLFNHLRRAVLSKLLPTCFLANIVKLLKKINFTKQHRTTPSVFIEHIFSQCGFSQNKIYIKMRISSLLIL